MTKIPEKVFLRFSDEEKRTMADLVEEQHAKLIQSGALLGPPSVATIIRSLIAREGARLDAAKELDDAVRVEGGDALWLAVVP